MQIFSEKEDGWGTKVIKYSCWYALTVYIVTSVIIQARKDYRNPDQMKVTTICLII